MIRTDRTRPAAATAADRGRILRTRSSGSHGWVVLGVAIAMLLATVLAIALPASALDRASRDEEAQLDAALADVGPQDIGPEKLTNSLDGSIAGSKREGPPISFDCCERPHDEVWLLNDRCNGCLGDGAVTDVKLGYERFDAGSKDWKTAKSQDFFTGPGAKLPTCYWVHGDRIDDDQAYRVGMTVYHALLRTRCKDAPPLRFVIWSWPTSRELRRPLHDVRLKASRIPATSFRLAWVLAHSNTETPLSMLGYSYGSRVICSGLSALAGTEIAGHTLADRPKEPRHAHVSLIASAVDYDSLYPGHRYGRALSEMDQLLLLNNSCDWVLRHYHWLQCHRSGPPALGHEGLCDLTALGPAAKKVRQVECACEIGKEHRWWLYMHSDSLLPQIQDVVLPVAKK